MTKQEIKDLRRAPKPNSSQAIFLERRENFRMIREAKAEAVQKILSKPRRK